MQDNGERYIRWLTCRRRPAHRLRPPCRLVCVRSALGASLQCFHRRHRASVPGAFSLDNFVEAYSELAHPALVPELTGLRRRHRGHHLRHGRAGRLVVERTDAPGANLFHRCAAVIRRSAGLLMAMAWIFVLSPNIGWGNA